MDLHARERSARRGFTAQRIAPLVLHVLAALVCGLVRESRTGRQAGGDALEKGNDQGAEEAEQGAGDAEQPGQPTGGSQADQSGPTRERDPWAGTPDLGETKLPDGTTLRRDADG